MESPVIYARVNVDIDAVSCDTTMFVPTEDFDMNRHSRNWVFTIGRKSSVSSPWQDELVGRSEIGTLSEAGEVVAAMHGLAR